MGLKIGLYQKYKNIYYYYFVRNGRQTSVSTKQTSREKAEQWVKEKHPAKIQHHKITIKDFINIHSEYINSNFEPNTISKYKYAFRYFNQINGRVYLKDITSQDLEDFKNELINPKNKSIKPLGKTTANMYLRAIKAALTYAFMNNYIGDNPGMRVKSFKQPEKEILAFTEEEVKRILELADDDMKRIIKFALLTGMRLREISSMKRSDIDGNILTIGREQRTKSKKIRKLAISKQLKEVIGTGKEEYLFPYRDPITITRYFKRILRKGGFPEKFHFHCLRHTFINNMLEKGIPLTTVGKIVGHSDVKTTMRYAHPQSINHEAMEVIRV